MVNLSQFNYTSSHTWLKSTVDMITDLSSTMIAMDCRVDFHSQ